jgi:antibiotic biosynthesis monooxygenase (ABM) superfamily enzyme
LRFGADRQEIVVAHEFGDPVLVLGLLTWVAMPFLVKAAHPWLRSKTPLGSAEASL